MATNKYKVSVGADTSRFKTDINKAITDTKAVKIKIEVDDTALKKYQNTISQTVTANEKLNNQLAKNTITDTRLAKEIANKTVAEERATKTTIQRETAEINKKKAITNSELAEKKLAQSIDNTSKKTSTLTSKMIDSTKKVARFGVSTAIIGGFYRAVKTAVDEVIKFDSALIELQKVSDLTGESLKEFKEEAFELGEELSTSATNVTDAVAEFKKSGYSIDESLQLGKSALIFQTISDGAITASDSATFLTQTLKAYQMQAEEAVKITDSINEVSNNYSISSTDLSQSIGKVASTANLAGVSFDQLLGIMVASNEIVQNSSKVANGYKSILVNLVNKDLEKQFKSVGIEVRDLETGALKPAYQLLQELSVVFNELGTTIDTTSGDTISLNENMNSLLEDIAGKFNINVLSAGLLNFEQGISATTTSINSAGSAQEEFSKSLDSIEKKIEGVKGQFLELVSGDGGLSTFIKLTLDATKGLLDFSNSGLGQFIIQTTLATTTLTLLYKGFLLLTSTAIPNLITWFNGLLLSIKANIGAMGLFKATLTALKLDPVVLGLTALIAVGYGAVKAFDYFNVTLEESVDKLKDLKSQSDSTNSEVETITQKLEDIRLKINEINKLDITDEEELTLLEEEEDALARQLVLLKQKAEIENYETSKQAKKTLEETTSSELKYEYKQGVTASGSNYTAVEVTPTQELSLATEELKQLNIQYEDLKQKSMELSASGQESSDAFIENAEAMKLLEDRMIQVKERGIEMVDIINLATEGAYGYTSEIEEEEKTNYDLIESWNGTYDSGKKVAEVQKDIGSASADTSSILENQSEIMSEMAQGFSEIQDSYDVLAKARDEYNETGNYSLDTLTQLLELEPEYLRMLSEEGEVASISETMIRNKIIAQAEEAKQTIYGIAIAKLNAIASRDAGVASTEAGEDKANSVANIDSETQALMGNTKAKMLNSAVEASSRGGGEAEAEIQKILSETEDQIALIDKAVLGMGSNFSGAMGDSAKATGKATNALKDQKGELNDLKGQYQRVIDYVIDKFDDQIDAIEKARDAHIKAVEDERDAVLDGIDDQIEALEREKEAREEYWNNRIDKLKQENTERERAIQLEQYQQQLALAQSSQVKIYEDGQFNYGQDESAVSEAEQELFDYEQELSYQRQLEQLEALKQAEMDSYESRIQSLQDYRERKEEQYEQEIEALEEYYDQQVEILEKQKEAFEESVNAYEEEQDRLLASQLLGIDSQQNNWTTMLKNLGNFVTKWNSLLSQINSFGSSGSATSASVGISSYASGTPTVGDNEIAITGENPKYRELVIGSKVNNMNDMGVPIKLKKGSGVLPAGQTNTLVDLLSTIRSPSVQENSSTNNSTNSTVLQIQSVNVNANNADEFISSMKDFKNKMIQETYK